MGAFGILAFWPHVSIGHKHSQQSYHHQPNQNRILLLFTQKFCLTNQASLSRGEVPTFLLFAINARGRIGLQTLQDCSPSPKHDLFSSPPSPTAREPSAKFYGRSLPPTEEAPPTGGRRMCSPPANLGKPQPEGNELAPFLRRLQLLIRPPMLLAQRTTWASVKKKQRRSGKSENQLVPAHMALDDVYLCVVNILLSE